MDLVKREQQRPTRLIAVDIHTKTKGVLIREFDGVCFERWWQKVQEVD